MQDEPVGVNTTKLPPSAEEKSCNGKSGKEQNRPRSQPDPFTADYNRLNQKTGFAGFGRAFYPTQSICDLQHSQQIRQPLGQHPEACPADSPPPRGPLGHLPQRPLQRSAAAAAAADPRGSPVEEAEVDAASSSPTSVKSRQLQMDSSLAHHINCNGGGGGAGNMLSGGLGAAFPNLPAQELQSAGVGSSSPSLTGFGTPWSVQTSSSPPPAPTSINPIHANAINQMPNADSDSGFYPGIPSSINPAFFQSFSPLSANPCAGINVQGFSGPFSPQINVPQQAQSRRSPVSPQMHPQQGAFLQQRNNYNQHQVSCCGPRITPRRRVRS